MIGRFLGAAVLAFAAAAPLAHAQTQGALTGTYCLVGVMEVGSCIRLSDGGRFEYFLAYGAYDEKAEGTWKLENGEVVLDTPAYDRRPTFAYKRTQPGEGDEFGVIVENKNGRSIAGIDVDVTCDGTTKRAGATQEADFKIDCASAPTAVSLGLRMFDVAPQTIAVADRAGTNKAYVFEFDPGDLGRKRFVAQRLRRDGGGALLMVYANSPISELEGRTLRYEQSR